MGVDRPSSSHRCRWVRDRLPLLAGGELTGTDRRKVERHLIACPGCRAHEQSLDGAMGVLRAAAGLAPALADGRVGPDPEAPSLWPALARQIRESRHAVPRPSFRDFARPRLAPGLWPALGLAMGLGGVIAASLPRARDLPPAALPSPAPVQVVAVVPEAPAAPSRGPQLAGPTRPVASLTRGGVNPFESPAAIRINYDLDHGTPVGPGNRDPQHSY